MKKILLATTMIVGGASIAAADVTLSGSARMGVISPVDNLATTTVDEGDIQFTSRARVVFTMSGESDSGLSFGATFRADNAGLANSGDAGSVFISGAFGKLSMGDVDGAAQMATGHVAGVGLTGLGDLNESTFLGAGDGRSDPTALYEYSAGALTVYLSATNPVTVINPATPAVVGPPAVAAVPETITDTQAIAIGAKYTFGDYTVGLGYEKQAGKSAVVSTGADNVDLDHIVLKLSGTVAGVTVQGLIGQADGRLNSTTVLNNAKQYAMSVGYTSGALGAAAFYTDDSALGGTTAYGLGGSYDLGGGAKVLGGVAKTKVAGPDQTTFDLGVSLSF
jgi:outer membrane protein OmpU